MKRLITAVLLFVCTLNVAYASGEHGWMYQLVDEEGTPMEIHVYYTADTETDERVLRYITSLYPLLNEDGTVVRFEDLTAERIETVMNAWLVQKRTDLLQNVEQWEVAKAAEATEHNADLGCMFVPALEPMPPSL